MSIDQMCNLQEECQLKVVLNDNLRTSLGGPVSKTPHSQCREPGLIPGRGTRSRML